MSHALPFTVNLWIVMGIAIALLALLEILFLFARIIENEVALHNLKVRSHKLRLNMLTDSALQIIAERKPIREPDGESMIIDVDRNPSGSNLQPAPDEPLIQPIADAA